MPVQPGQQAPDFTLYTSDRQPWSLAQHRGEPVVVLFFPGAFTSVCTDEMTAVSDSLSDYEDLGARVVGISTDAPTVLAKFKEENGIRFPLLSDHEAEVAEQFGARFSREEHNLGYSRVAKRAAYVINPDGFVRYAEVTPTPGEQPDFGAIRHALRDLR